MVFLKLTVQLNFVSHVQVNVMNVHHKLSAHHAKLDTSLINTTVKLVEMHVQVV